MAVLNLRGVPDELVAELKSRAALARVGLRDYCVEVLSRAATVGGGTVSCPECASLNGLHQRGCSKAKKRSARLR